MKCVKNYVAENDEVGEGLYTALLLIELKFMIGLTGQCAKWTKNLELTKTADHNRLIVIKTQPIDHHMTFSLMNAQSVRQKANFERFSPERIRYPPHSKTTMAA